MDSMENQEGRIESYAMLPMRDIVVFPHMTTPFFIGRKQSIEALEKALAGDRKLVVIAQKNPDTEKPEQEDLHSIGTIGNIIQIMRLPNGTIKALFEAESRCKIISADISGNAYTALVQPLSSDEETDPEVQALVDSVRSEFQNYIKKTAKNIEASEHILKSAHQPDQLADLIAPLLNCNLEKKQELLEELNTKSRLEKIYIRMLEEQENKKLEQKLKERVQGQIGKTQKEYYLNEQMKAIQKELGGEDQKNEVQEYTEKIKQSAMSEEAKDIADKELKKLKMMPSTSSEANIVRTYLDWLITVPWKCETSDNYNLEHAQQILDEDHYGLEKVKERIIEYIAVASYVGKVKGPILCLVGPPGVGKTSLARSVARALDRNFTRISLGGVRDEAEVRGHRRTYIGAMPGKIIQTMKKGKTKNPLMLLDEIDKMTQSHMGDPAAALLEVLDPEQNNTFMDHYMEVEYDLSDVLFLCTANTMQDIPYALRDRLEIINLSGYTELEKERIGMKYLIPKQMELNGLDPDSIKFGRKALLETIRLYTKEAGVRKLEQTVAKVCRKVVTELIKHKSTKSITITSNRIHKYLGVPKYRFGKIEENNEVGVTTGLAWTSVGGELLSIEVGTMRGNGKISLTGKLGDVMKESAQTALSYVRSNANNYGIYSKLFKNMDIHVHVPEGATPKDGPSAGVTLTTSLISALTGIPVIKEVAMTGEVTLRGKVLPIGGLKEKLLAAKRGQIEKVLIPHENVKDLEDVPGEILSGIEVIPVKNVSEVLEIALERLPNSVSDDHQEGDADKKIGFAPVEERVNNNITPIV